MEKKESDRIDKFPIREVKKRINAFFREVKSENVSTSVSSIVAGGQHSISLSGASKNYTIDVSISKRA